MHNWYWKSTLQITHIGNGCSRIWMRSIMLQFPWLRAKIIMKYASKIYWIEDIFFKIMIYYYTPTQWDVVFVERVYAPISCKKGVDLKPIYFKSSQGKMDICKPRDSREDGDATGGLYLSVWSASLTTSVYWRASITARSPTSFDLFLH